MPMAFKMRSTKFRHVYGRPFRKEQCFENVRITRNAHDSHFCAVNTKFLSVVTESAGGGSFIVLPIDKSGRVDINTPKVCGHSGAVMDIKWSPFNDNVIASGSDDSTIKVWEIPKEGLLSNLTEWSVDLHGHQRKVAYLEWHPTAENILLSAGFDSKCIIWNVEQAEPVNIIEGHNDNIFSMFWNNDGSLFCTTSKDKRLRVIDPRRAQVVVETDCHQGYKTSKSVFLRDNNRIFTTGFSRTSERQYALWDVRNMDLPIVMNVIDFDSGTLLPYYDPDLNIVYVAGKGNGNIRYYEMASEDPYVHFLNSYQSPSPQRGLSMMPKRGCDVTTCEVLRFYKLHAAKNLIEPISMICPRKSDKFQEDIYPPTHGTIPSLSADEWISGQNREPILVSVADGHVLNTPKITTSKAVQKQEGVLNLAPTITTYKAVNKQNRENRSAPKRANTIATDTIINNNHQEPASLRNIKRLSTNEDYVSIKAKETSNPSPTTDVTNRTSHPPVTSKRYEPVVPQSYENDVDIAAWEEEALRHYEPRQSRPANSYRRPADRRSGSTSPKVFLREKYPPPPPSPSDTGAADFSERKAMFETSPSPVDSPAASRVEKRVWSPTSPIYKDPSTNGVSDSDKIHVRKMWQQPQTISHYGEDNSNAPNTDAELKKAYFRQQDEIRQLQEQIALKDKRIRQLEEEVRGVRETSCGPGESNC